ncbi:hypothetical protein [Epilithonimonas caeni]|uniref:hypothetical protein n=1 Tax=Epilithonimonas caeni TaxID=365343 RepID=UPI0004071166|nr:hypothetical protein [Epilithonimonas caeni]
MEKSDILKKIIVLLGLIIAFLLMCIYWRTGYFKISIQTNKTTIYLRNGDSIKTQNYYRDLSGNWIILDRNLVVPESNWKAMSVN